MMKNKRLTPEEQTIVENMLIAEMMHRGWLKASSFHKYQIQEYGIFLSTKNVKYYLNRLVKRGLVKTVLHERGWYKYYTYNINPDNYVPF